MSLWRQLTHGLRRLAGYGIFAGVGGAGAQAISSYIVPSFLFDDVTIWKPGTEAPNLPVTPPPSAAG